MTKLTKQQIERQDFVDNHVFELMRELLPPSKQINWNIEIISAIRDAIGKQIIDKKCMSEMQFYPYIKI